jgi:hypothetical protein
VTEADVAAWLERYIAAWRSWDEAAIGDLFAAEAEYRFHPSDEPFVGRAAIVRAWTHPEGLAGVARDEPGTWEASYTPWLVGERRAVAVGTSRFWTDHTHATLAEVWDNCFLLEFDPEGRCTSYTEYSNQRADGG